MGWSRDHLQKYIMANTVYRPNCYSL